MSATAPALPDTQMAYDTLVMGVENQVFFHKCANAGYTPRTEAEAQQMLTIADKLTAAEEYGQQKQAAAGDSPFARMNAALDNALAKHGVPVKTAASRETEHSFRQAARQLATDPTFYNSVLSLKQAEAESIRQQLEASK